MRNTKTFYLENLGCAKNQVDAEGMASRLLGRGWTEAADPAEASCIIVNTCGFIESAKKESIDTVLGFRRHYPHTRIVLAGCLAERYGRELFDALPETDAVFGNRDPARIDEILAAPPEGGRILLLPEVYGTQPLRRRTYSPPGSVYIKAAEGCDNRCSFCAIPLIRGGVRSRREEEILREIERFLESGIVEFNLVAQDLGCYGRDLPGSAGLAGLVEAVSRLPGRFWLRMLYIHPEHFPREILAVCRRDPRILPYFDLPFQHAAPGVLAAMGRRNTAEKNLDLVDEIRAELPGAVIRSTFLVGFPGETEADFATLLSFQKAARFDWLGAFTFSAEEGTPADRLARKKGMRVPKKIARARLEAVREAQISITEERLSRFVGLETEFLVEEPVLGADLSLARGYMNAPEVDGLVVLVRSSAPGASSVSGIRVPAAPPDRVPEDASGAAPAAPPGSVPGHLVRGRITRRNGIDLEAEAL